VLAACRDPKTAPSHANIEPIALDVTKPEAIAAAVQPIDVLVNNAGISMNGFDERVARGTIDTNFYGPLHLTDAFLPSLKPGGRVIMVSSGLGELSGIGDGPRQRFAKESLTREELLALVEEFVRDVKDGVHAKRGWPTSAYRVSKAALNALTRIYARDGVHANAVDPGWVRTDMGGSSAPRSLSQGAETIVWLATATPQKVTGRVFRDREPVGF
jgi:NAD(P)-dependent dehydrogenase (short-subunit alcohol dehydrogenase family)